MRIRWAIGLISVIVLACAACQGTTESGSSASTDSTTSSTNFGPKAAEPPTFAPTEQQRKAIEDVLNAQPDFKAVGIVVSELEVHEVWALATIEPKQKETAEGAIVLLKNDNGWQMLDYGTDLTGDGEKFGVPKLLIERWEL